MFAFNIFAPHPAGTVNFAIPAPATLAWHLCKIPAENVVCGCWLVLLVSALVAVRIHRNFTRPTPSSLAMILGRGGFRFSDRPGVKGGCYEKAISSHMHGGFALHSSPLWLGVVVVVGYVCVPSRIHTSCTHTHIVVLDWDLSWRLASTLNRNSHFAYIKASVHAGCG